ncbi:MAG: helix-turn-helix domain-containing protein [Acidobacteria bacterium]|nr:helix-turn-helix domain-containing protein [Acidobacteriota bacterium]MCZ6750656.1 helix-turn-helix domain-containing protein [Acidobacteriota bacterium]
MENRSIAEAFPPGEFVKEELEARGWTQEDLAEIIGRQTSVVNAIINAKRAVSPDLANDLGTAFGTGPEYWMNLETMYQLFIQSDADDSISRKARLFDLAPIKEMVKRGWIKETKDIGVLESRVLKFLERKSVEEDSKLLYAAKKSTATANPAQVAWVCRAKKIARGIRAARFSDKSFADALAKLRELRANPEDTRYASKILGDAGVRLVLVEGLSKGRIDGATFWLDQFSPVIAISMRYDRLDHFWFLLSHECGHVKNRDALGGKPILDIDLVGDNATPFEEKTNIEQHVDIFAEEFLVEKDEMESFINRVRPLYSKQKIKNFAARIGVHPAIVLGQLQYRKEVDWSHSREMLVKVREILISSTLTDGWGHTLPVNM